MVHRSRNLEATKDVFYPFASNGEGKPGSDDYALGAHSGWRVHDIGNMACAEAHIFWNFSHLVEARVAFIGLATLTPMSFRVDSDYCQAETGYNQHNCVNNLSVNTVLNRLQECDVSQTLIALLDGAQLEAGDYLGLYVSRQAGQNTNALFLGLRLKYNIPTYSHAP